VSSNPRPWLSVTDIQKAFYAGKIVFLVNVLEVKIIGETISQSFVITVKVSL
jgi:hypothetical protein